ncbi:hypothetical protein M885DRAFT_120949 [Pelagophyceae sp. CCMP2097]|nr:hypothetical protein M885DRAFT_120949 [Pelagophyceae sp. CCMP2097]
MGALFRDFQSAASSSSLNSLDRDAAPRPQPAAAREPSRGAARGDAAPAKDRESAADLAASLSAAVAHGDAPDHVDRACRRAERHLRQGGAKDADDRALCDALREARGDLMRRAPDATVAVSHARAAWSSQHMKMQKTLEALKKTSSREVDHDALRSVLLKDVEVATHFFASLLELALRNDVENEANADAVERASAYNARGATHALLMALGDLERYREAYGAPPASRPTYQTAEALYLQAQRARAASGRAAGMVATVCALRRDAPAAVAHWAWRAHVAREPWEGGRGLALTHFEKCRAALDDTAQATGWRGTSAASSSKRGGAS